MELHVNELIKIAGGRQLDDHVFPRAWLLRAMPLMARVFGAGMATDAFFVAFKLPNLLRRIFAEGAFSQAFVPILAEYKSKQGEDATRVFVAYVSGLLTLALAIVTVLGHAGSALG